MKTYNESELNNIRKAGDILKRALVVAEQSIRVGISTLEIDKIVDGFIVLNGAEPSFKNYRGYGYATCISINDEVVHGMPRADKLLHDGDIISIDIGVRWDGFCADAARTFGVGEISTEAKDLIMHTEQSFKEAVNNLKAGSTVGDIGLRIENYIRQNTSYSILEQYFGHGIGRGVHEEPLIPNFIARTPQLKAIARKQFPTNTAICIEPMICIGNNKVETKADGWTVVTSDGKLSAHYENTLIVHDDGVEVVT